MGHPVLLVFKCVFGPIYKNIENIMLTFDLKGGNKFQKYNLDTFCPPTHPHYYNYFLAYGLYIIQDVVKSPRLIVNPYIPLEPKYFNCTYLNMYKLYFNRVLAYFRIVSFKLVKTISPVHIWFSLYLK